MDTRQLQLLHFCLLLGISLAALLGNGLIISAVACGHHLHTLAVSVLYSVVTPALNPFIYSLRNEELKASMWALMTGCFQRQ
ncbi:olfactory receptor 1073-like [Passerculus sandwichensis]